MGIKVKYLKRQDGYQEKEYSFEFIRSGNIYYRLNERFVTILHENHSIVVKPTGQITEHDLPTDIISENITQEHYDEVFKEFINWQILTHNEQNKININE